MSDDTDEEILGAARERLLARLEGRYDHMPRPRTLGERPGARAESRWLIPGLQKYGTIPMLGGPPKVGKTLLIADYVAALLIDDYRFLDHFEPATLDYDEKDRRVLVINAETPPEDFEAALLATGLGDFDEDTEPWSNFVRVEHLEELGGPQVFDLTDDAIFEMWLQRMIPCEDCDGDDDAPTPIAIVVDGLTAILGGTTDRYGPWYARFRQLCRALGVPNALVTGHTTLAGDHLMGGVEAQAGPDGLWTYTKAQDNARAQRRFRVEPRLGGVPFGPERVDLVEGRMTITQHARKSSNSDELSVIEPDRSAKATSEDERLFAFIQSENAKGNRPTAREVRQIGGAPAAITAATKRLIDAGRIEVGTRPARGGGHAYWAVPIAGNRPDGEVI
ncbi:AAA family ATPase [Demequina salsinemoris]|uniref:AAA family ATPase n=1 Tax=Demequina salsinemoris TaxID=577470 RepID=UPI0013649C24|nr:AAA family ATPase [Demequina salsinemoris]